MSELGRNASRRSALLASEAARDRHELHRVDQRDGVPCRPGGRHGRAGRRGTTETSGLQRNRDPRCSSRPWSDVGKRGRRPGSGARRERRNVPADARRDARDVGGDRREPAAVCRLPRLSPTCRARSFRPLSRAPRRIVAARLLSPARPALERSMRSRRWGRGVAAVGSRPVRRDPPTRPPRPTQCRISRTRLPLPPRDPPAAPLVLSCPPPCLRTAPRRPPSAV